MPLVVPYIATYQVVSEMKRWNASGRKVKFNDLRPGMLINGLGLIIEVGQPWSSRMYDRARLVPSCRCIMQANPE